MPATPEELFAFLERLGISTSTVEHEAMFTVAESSALRSETLGAHTRNLFVKDKKGRLFLLVLGAYTPIELKRTHERLGAQGRLSFAPGEQLEEAWGVKPGSVTPLGALNDRDIRVTVVLDTAMMAEETLSFHPLVNTRTTTLASADLVTFLRATGHEPVIIPLGAA
jgi:Ala-tRNA(Pro) deacylase